jgi:hypothetical protein
LGEQRPEDDAGLAAGEPTEHGPGAEARGDAAGPHALAAGMQMDVVGVTASLDRDRQQRMRPEDRHAGAGGGHQV